MTGPANWPRVQEVFADAVALPARQRAACLASACGDDVSLREQVEMLLDSQDWARRFLETTPKRPRSMCCNRQRNCAY